MILLLSQTQLLRCVRTYDQSAFDCFPLFSVASCSATGFLCIKQTAKTLATLRLPPLRQAGNSGAEENTRKRKRNVMKRQTSRGFLKNLSPMTRIFFFLKIF